MFAIVQYEDRPLNEFSPLVQQNRRYAEKHGIDYIFYSSGWENYPPWWRKVFAVRELMEHYAAVMWVDSDAAIVGHEHFQTLFADRHFVLSPNPPMLNSQSLSMFSAPFCAGVWGVRSTCEGKVLMDRWIRAYNSHLWSNVMGWTHTRGLYAGEAYEQGSFEIAIWRCKDFADWIENKASHVLNYLPKSDSFVKGSICPSVFAVHYWKGNRAHIKDHWP